MSHFIIIANGNFLVREIISAAIQHKRIVALDGAVNKLTRLGIKPQVILGDFDSITDEVCSYWGIQKTFDLLHENDEAYQGHHGVTIVPAKNQQLTDLSKAIHYCDQQGAKHITLICATGGRLDHHEGVLRSLRKEYKKDRAILLHTEQQTLQFAKDETVLVSGEIGDKCGLLAYPKACVSSVGLAYEAKQLELRFGFSESTCNALSCEKASLTVTGEALLILPPQLQAQRDFMNKNEAERLTLLLRDLTSSFMKI
jgi:thiamine pyrophosphokinase